jgi:hypothetical protein
MMVHAIAGWCRTVDRFLAVAAGQRSEGSRTGTGDFVAVGSFVDFFAGDGKYFLLGLLALLGVGGMAFLLAAVEDRLFSRGNERVTPSSDD